MLLISRVQSWYLRLRDTLTGVGHRPTVLIGLEFANVPTAGGTVAYKYDVGCKMKRFLGRMARRWFRMQMRAARSLLGEHFVLKRLAAYARWLGADTVLRELGAKIGDKTQIPVDVVIQNASRGRCGNLEIGQHAYIGPGCLFDLASKITIEESAAVSARVCIVTHADVGARVLSNRFPRKEGPVVVGSGAWIGVNTTILHGVTIGQRTVVGAMSLVNKSLPDDVVAYGIPCRIQDRSEESSGEK